MALEYLQYSKDDLSFSLSHIHVFILIWVSEHILSEMLQKLRIFECTFG